MLSDILGDEDHLGDMDFKVAGTDGGITSLQMDIKISGITEEIMKVALGQAKDGRLHILGEMAKALTTARAELGEHAPRIETFKIPTDKIREVIGTGRQGDPRDRREDRRQGQHRGRRLGEGRLRPMASRSRRRSTGSSRSPPIRKSARSTTAPCVKTMDFGAFVNFFGAKDGLVHISQLADRSACSKTTDVVKEGDKVKVKLLGFDDRGKVRLSMKVGRSGRPAKISKPSRRPRRRAAGARRRANKSSRTNQ